MKKAIVGNLVKFTFDENLPGYVFDCTKMSGANRAHAIPFAMSHRLGDSAAIARKQPDGSVVVITEQMRRANVAELGDWLQTGTDQWDMRTVRAPVQNPVWAAMAEKRGVGYDVIAAEHAQADLDALAAM